jgi:hypothetical protein
MLKETIAPRIIKPSAIVVIAISIYCIVFSEYWKNWKDNTPFVWDVRQYYVYLPATLIHKDLTFHFPHNCWMNYLPNGNQIPRATYGMSFMYLPSFLVGYKLAHNAKEFPIDGFSQGFIDAIHYGSIMYFIFSLLLLRSVLSRFFRDSVVAIGIILIFFGTNLFYYTMVDCEMPHNYLFFLFLLFIWLTIKWHEAPKYKFSIFLGIVLGLIALIRPTEILIAAVFLLYNVKNRDDFKSALIKFRTNWRKVLTIALGFLIMLLPQLIYWKIMSGKFFFFSYGDEERFFFGQPKIIEVLFSYRKGWLLYTPLMIFALVGLFFSKKYVHQFNHSILIYVAITLYLISSWWCWWFGGGFGMRAMVQSYALLVFPLCCVVDVVFFNSLRKKVLDFGIKYSVLILLIGCVYLNILQTLQYNRGMIHWDAMNKKAYWIVFGKFKWQNDDEGKFWGSLTETRYDKAKKGIR